MQATEETADVDIKFVTVGTAALHCSELPTDHVQVAIDTRPAWATSTGPHRRYTVCSGTLCSQAA